MQRTEASRRSGDTSCEVLPQQELQVRVKDGATTAEGSLTLFRHGRFFANQDTCSDIQGNHMCRMGSMRYQQV